MSGMIGHEDYGDDDDEEEEELYSQSPVPIPDFPDDSSDPQVDYSPVRPDDSSDSDDIDSPALPENSSDSDLERPAPTPTESDLSYDQSSSDRQEENDIQQYPQEDSQFSEQSHNSTMQRATLGERGASGNQRGNDFSSASASDGVASDFQHSISSNESSSTPNPDIHDRNSHQYRDPTSEYIQPTEGEDLFPDFQQAQHSNHELNDPLLRSDTTDSRAMRQVHSDLSTPSITPSAARATPPYSSDTASIGQKQEQEEQLDIFDVLIIGGGVVGLAVLRAATLEGFRCILIEAEADLLRGASSANSGIACTGVDALPGTLERALVRDSISQLRPFLKSYRIPHRDCGSLVCQWEWDRVYRDGKYNSPLASVLSQCRDAGDVHARKLTAEELGALEPNVSPLCVGAVYVPGEIVVDSWLYSISLAAHARENGAQIVTNFEYDPEQSWFDEEKCIWNVYQRTTSDDLGAETLSRILYAKAVVNATGIDADVIQAATADVSSPHWKSIPRRGQYRVFMADNCTHVMRPIQPLPTQQTKGIFVYSSLYDHLVVGPTAQDQDSRYDRTVDPAVADELTGFALRVLPDLDPYKQYVADFVGIRPATDHRDYQIRISPQSNWIVAAGIRSTGLTASLGIGRHITDLLKSLLPLPSPLRSIRTSHLPPMQELVHQYNSNHDGNVLIHGYLYRVTHPLTQLGFKIKSGIASDAR